MIRFILNDQAIKTSFTPGTTVLDFVRYHKRLMGTKIGCREGDCGACTILAGSLENEKLVYRSMTCCLMPLANAQGKHIVTVEGINARPPARAGTDGDDPRLNDSVGQAVGRGKELSAVQQALVDTNGTQCGFCTPGFVMSLTGFVLNQNESGIDDAIRSVDGNICRCTGYKSIERAAKTLSDVLVDKPESNTIEWLVKKDFIPAYFTGIKERLLKLKTEIENHSPATNGTLIIGGGTDLVVQQHGQVKKAAVRNFFDNRELKEITLENNKCAIGGSVTVTEFSESPVIQTIFPDLKKYIKLISSTPIRNMATLAGNLVNASPIGDMTIFFLALNAEIVLNNGSSDRTIYLKDFYKGYKQLAKNNEEFIEKIIFTKPPAGSIFNFEKVCKRTWLDIASVNSACWMQTGKDGAIKDIHLSAGGVAPFPKYLSGTVAFLRGKIINTAVLNDAIKIINEEIAPITDARGTKEYKRLLLRQLFLAHFPRHLNGLREILIHR